MSKVIILDWGYYLFTAGHTFEKNPKLYFESNCLGMIIGDLKKVGVNKEDTVIIAVDYHGEDYSSWRKALLPCYKGGRTPLQQTTYDKANELLKLIDRTTNFNIVIGEHLEADDSMAAASRYYKDKEVILLTADSDMEQCLIYPNVKIFSPHRLMKRYKIKPKNFNVHSFIAKKIRKEIADNIVSPILNKEDYKKREQIVSLIKLPEWVEEMVIRELETMEKKEKRIELMPYRKIRERFTQIYDSDKIITYEKSVKIMENRAKKKLKTKGGKRNGK